MIDTNIENTQTVKQARAEVEAAAQRLSELERSNEREPDPLANARDEHQVAVQRFYEAREEAVQSALAALETEYVSAVKTLSASLEAAAAANMEVTAISEKAARLTGKANALPNLSWTELLTPDHSSRTSKLLNWRRLCAAYLETQSASRQSRRRRRLRQHKDTKNDTVKTAEGSPA